MPSSLTGDGPAVLLIMGLGLPAGGSAATPPDVAVLDFLASS